MDNIESFKERLNKFINRYYIISVLRGLIIIPILYLLEILIISSIEYFGWLSVDIRRLIFFFTIISFLFFFFYFLIIPLFRFLGIFKRITFHHVAAIIKINFPIIYDKVINIIELDDIKYNKNDLIHSSIEQKINQVSDIDFNKALVFKDRKKYFKFVLCTFLLFSFTLLLNPNIILEGSSRIINYNKIYVRENQFNVNIDEDNLFVERGKDLKINVEVTGDNLPNELFIKYGNSNFILHKLSSNRYTYTFKNVNNNFNFYIINNFFKSKSYNVDVINIPIIKDFSITVNFPDYLNRKDETYKNISELKVPSGSELFFSLNTFYSDSILIVQNDSVFKDIIKDNVFNFNTLIVESSTFSLSFRNVFTEFLSNIFINIYTIPDLFPSIDVNYVKDENNYRLYFFHGIINDDYGFTNLFVDINSQKIDIPINKYILNQEFYFSYEIPVNSKNQNIEFFVFDNDEISGPKFSKSNSIYVEIPDATAIDSIDNINANEIENKIEESFSMVNQLKKDIEQLQKNLINENISNWERQNRIDAISQKQKTLEEYINDLINKNKEKDNFSNTFNDNAEEIKSKQEKIQELYNNLLTDDIKKLLDELQKLADNYNKDKLNDVIQNLKFNYNDLSKQLDKNLELMKRLKLEDNLQKQLISMDKLVAKSKDLYNSLNKNSSSKDSLLNYNKEFSKDMEEFIDRVKENNNLNNQLEDPYHLTDFTDELSDIKKSTDENSENITNQSNKSKEKSKSAFEKLENLAEEMRSEIEGNIQDQEGEDADVLRQILENLFTFSFNIENLMNDFLVIDYDNPKYIELINMNKNYIDDFKIIHDSLYSLSERTPEVSSFINSRVLVIESEMAESNNLFEDKNIGSGRTKMQIALTNTNDLIILLTESLKNMEQQGSGSGGGKKSKKSKPKNGKESSLSDLKKGQESIKEQLEDMLKDVKGGNLGQSNSKSQMGKILSQQEIYQKMLNDLYNNGNVGSQTQKILNEINQLMEQNRYDIIDMNINQQTLNRQKMINTRLLQAENAELERDKDEQRKATEAYDYKRSNPQNLFEESNESINFNEIFQLKSVNLFEFYQYKYQEYIKQIDNEKRN